MSKIIDDSENKLRFCLKQTDIEEIFDIEEKFA